MKRILFIPAALLTVFSAVGKSPKSGYRGFVEWNNSITTEPSFLYEDKLDAVYYSGISTSHGYQFNDTWFLGAGLSIENNKKYNSYILPIYVEGRADLQFGRFTPYADLRVGMSLTDGGGLYLSPSIGYRFNWGRRFGINVAAGATVKGIRYDIYDMNLSPEGYLTINQIGSANMYKCFFSFRLGVEF